MKFLKELTPRTCYIISRNDAYASLENLQEEPIYGSKFRLEPIDEAQLDMMEKVMPNKGDGEELFHAEQNPFMPKRALISKRAKNEKNPYLISEEVKKFGV